MKINDRVKIHAGIGSIGPPPRLLGQEGVIVYQAGPRTTVRLLDGELFVCYEDEMELVSTHEGEICQKCNEPVDCVWSAPSKLWQEVTGFENGGILCPKCFATCVEECLHTFLYWSCDTRGYPGLRFSKGLVKSIDLGIFHQRAKLWLGRHFGGE